MFLRLPAPSARDPLRCPAGRPAPATLFPAGRPAPATLFPAGRPFFSSAGVSTVFFTNPVFSLCRSGIVNLPSEMCSTPAAMVDLFPFYHTGLSPFSSFSPLISRRNPARQADFLHMGSSDIRVMHDFSQLLLHEGRPPAGAGGMDRIRHVKIIFRDIRIEPVPQIDHADSPLAA